MKKVIVTVCFLTLGYNASFAQTASVGKESADGSGILDFPSGNPRGIILPWVTSEASVASPTQGTLIYDVAAKMIKVYNEETSDWEEMGRAGLINTTVQDSQTEVAGQKTVIGAQTSSADGVLVLEATDKALVLPKMASPQTNYPSPAAGTMVYDTVSKMVCVYNGEYWWFWSNGN